MAPNLFSSSNRESSAVKYFEIRLDQSNLILRGSEHEASSAQLKGTLVLCLSEPLRVQGIRLRFTGERRIAWYQLGNGPNYMKQLEEFMRQTWDFKTKTETLTAGNYEWPFNLILPGNTPESLEGLPETWIVYRMKATIERGMLQHNSIARKQVRLIRTLDPIALELSHAMSVENVWAGKIEYSLSTPSKAVMFGATITVDFRLIPHLKGLKIGKITTELLQRQNLTIRTTRSFTRTHTQSHRIYTDEYQLPESAETEDIHGQEGYVFSRPIPIPQTLRKCVQSFDGLDIRIRHHLSFNVQMHNPDGHVSELHANLPVNIFLSPNLPIGDDNNMVNGSSDRIAVAASELNDLTPPQYGEHTLDRLYSDIDPSGYMTPGGQSGLNTPLNSRSRSVSTEDLVSMNAMASNNFEANVLQNQLGGLDAAGPAGSHRTARERSQIPGSVESVTEQVLGQMATSLPSASPSGGLSTERNGISAGQTPSDTISRRPSEEDGGRNSPQHIEYSAETLAQVPSYSTALQSNHRTPIKEGLPTYQAATQPSGEVPSVPQASGPVNQYNRARDNA